MLIRQGFRILVFLNLLRTNLLFIITAVVALILNNCSPDRHIRTPFQVDAKKSLFFSIEKNETHHSSACNEGKHVTPCHNPIMLEKAIDNL